MPRPNFFNQLIILPDRKDVWKHKINVATLNNQINLENGEGLAIY